MSWPALSLADARAQLTAPGAPFETAAVEVRGHTVRAYVRARPTLRAVLDESRRFGSRDFLRYEDERLSFEAHWRAAQAFGHVLLAGGVRKGDRVALASRNYPEWSVCAWGTLAVGAVLAPLNAWEPGPTLARMIEDCGATTVVADVERLDRLEPVLPTDVRTILIRDPEGAGRGGERLDALIGPVPGYADLPDDVLPDPSLEPDDPATLFYTSGTTGRAKGALGSHRNIATNIVNVGYRAARAALRRRDPLPPPSAALPAERRQLVPVPFFHVTGFHSNLAPALVNGTTLHLMHKWDVAKALDLISRERLHGLALVPSQARQLVDAAAACGLDLGSVDMVGYGGAAAPPGLAEGVRLAFPNAAAGQGYGATETSSLAASNSHEDLLAHPACVGPEVACCDVRLVDEAGRDVGPGQPGELWIAGPNVVLGYWNAPESTAEAFVGPWYRTGDIASRDADGMLTILDRAKDMLIRGGENIYCVEIEDVLASHPDVAEAAVFGVPHEVLGEVVGAVVCPWTGGTVSPERLRAHAAEHLAAHKHPTLIVIRDAPLPRNAVGKVLKREVKAQALAEQAAQGAS